MNALWLVIISILIFVLAYATYGRWVAKQWGVDANRVTPAH